MKSRNHTLLPLAAFAAVATTGATQAAVITPTIDAPLTTTTAVGGYEIGKTVDSSGLSGGGTSGNVLAETNDNGATQWLNGGAIIGNEVVTFDLGGTYDVDSVHLWNWVFSNDTSTKWGVKTVDISFSTDGTNFLNTETVSFIANPAVFGPATSQTQTFSTKAGVTHIQLDGFTNFEGSHRVGFGEIRFGGTGATPVDPVLSQDLVNGDPDLDFGTVVGSAPFSESRTVRFVNDGPTNAIEISTATVSGDAAYSLSDIAINGSGGISLPQSLAVGDYIEFTVVASLAAPASGVTGNLIIDTDAVGQDENLPITGSFTDPPPIITPTINVPLTTTTELAGYELGKTVDSSGLTDPNVTPGNILDDVHDNGTTQWLNGGANIGAEVVTYNLGGTYDVDSVHLWNWIFTNTTGDKWGVATVDISFSSDGVNFLNTETVSFDDATTNGATFGPAAVQTRAFATKSGVTHIRMASFTSFESGNRVGFGEIRFGGIPSTGGGNDFSDWIAGYSVGGQTGIGDDPDLDGVDSGVENFFGTAPDESTQGLVSGTVSGNTFTFTHPQGTLADDLTAAYRWSKGLVTFNADGATDGDGTKVDFTVQPDTPSAGTTTVTATVTGTATDKLFVNVEVTQD